MVITDRLKDGAEHPFVEVFEHCLSRVHAVFVFLSILELVQEQQLRLTIGEGYNNFWVRLSTEEERAAVASAPQENSED